MPPENPRHSAKSLGELQSILSKDYGQHLGLDEVSQIADWLTSFYTSLIKLAGQRRQAEREAARLENSLLDDPEK